MEIKRVALIGLGAIGSYLAPGLYATLGKENFLVIASGERRCRMEREGTTINGITYHFTIADPAEGKLAPADLIIVLVKWPQLAEAIEQIGFLVGENTTILSLMNGISSETLLAEAYGQEHIIYGLTRVSITRVGHTVQYDPKLGALYFGEKNNNRKPYSPRIAAIDALFTRAGIPHIIPEDAQREIWLKFCANIGENMPNAILGNCYGSWSISDHADYVLQSAFDEAAAIAEKFGVHITQADRIAHRKGLREAPFYNKSSTRQDIENKRPTEVAMFSGEVVRLGKTLGVPTPVNEWMYHAICLLEEMNSGRITEENIRPFSD